MAVGYSMSPKKTTEGEAEMFISMGQNDSAGSMLFISPIKLSRLVKRILEKEGVATWDRMALAIAIGEQTLNEWSKVEKEPIERSVMDLFETEDIDPVHEVRKYHREVSSSDVGGFKIHQVEVSPPRIEVKEEQIIPEVIPDQKESADVVMPEPKEEEAPPKFDLPMMPMMEMEPPEEVPVKKETRKKEKTDHKVPEEILMDPWSGFGDQNEETSPKDVTAPEEKPPKKMSNGWIGATLAPEKCSNTEAISLAGEGEETELKKINFPFIILEVSYQMDPADGKESIEQDGFYLYDCVRKDVMDVPGTVYDEIFSIKTKWDGSDAPKKMTDPKDDHNMAMVTLRKMIKSGKLKRDRKVQDTLMSTIYKEIDYRFDPKSLKLISSRRVILPFWVKEGKRGKEDWAVNGFLGNLIK